MQRIVVTSFFRQNKTFQRDFVPTVVVRTRTPMTDVKQRFTARGRLSLSEISGGATVLKAGEQNQFGRLAGEKMLGFCPQDTQKGSLVFTLVSAKVQ